MKIALASTLAAFLASRAVLLLLVAAFCAVTLIGVTGMRALALVSETMQSSGSAIDATTNLRRLAHRIHGIVVAEALGRRKGQTDIAETVARFDAALGHPALIGVFEREHGGVSADMDRNVGATWRELIKPPLLELAELRDHDLASPARYAAVLDDVDGFVARIDARVAALEDEAKSRISQLRTMLAVALALTVAIVLAAIHVMRRRVFQPLAGLRTAAGRIARRDFSARSEYTGRDELGSVGEAFNAMAVELSKAYLDLEKEVMEKTADLARTTRSLELLYHLITRLYHAPSSTEPYVEILIEIERLFGLAGIFACVQSKHGGPVTLLHGRLGGCAAGDTGVEETCRQCPGRIMPWSYRRDGGNDVLIVPLRDSENLYGMFGLMLPAGQRLENWQKALIEAVSRHIGIALGVSRQTERERLIALQEERSIIARELHDSIAQSLSYMKIQASLLQPVISDPNRHVEAAEVLEDLREGISSAYRQLRELLSSFRLKMEGDFSRLLLATAEEFSARGGIPVDVEMRLAACSLNANQEIHVLQIIREALSNATRHSGATGIRVGLACSATGEVTVVVDDDGSGIDFAAVDEHRHYGVAIMGERARGLGGEFAIGPRPGGGTRVSVRFDPRGSATANPRNTVAPAS